MPDYIKWELLLQQKCVFRMGSGNIKAVLRLLCRLTGREMREKAGGSCLFLYGTYSAVRQNLDLGEQMLGQALEESDLLLIEADGSNRKPLKGWREDEPVILPATEATIGILPMHCLGEILDVTKVHRMEKFTAITGLEPGDVMTEKAYLQLITAENGLFGHSLGSRWLVLNRVK